MKLQEILLLIHLVKASQSFTFGNQMNSCEERCNAPPIDELCDCHEACIVYKSCCQDLEQMCPENVNLAMARFGNIADTPVRCGPRSAHFEINGCVPEEDVRDRPRNSNSTLLQPPFDQFPIYDTNLDLLFSNISIYSCYRDDLTFAQLWQLVAKVSLEHSLQSMEDIIDLLNTTDYYFKPPMKAHDGVKCIDTSIPRDYTFSITVDFRDSFMEVNFFPRSVGYDFETMVCDNNESGSCLHTLCGPFSNLNSGKCIRNCQFVIRSQHPPIPFTWTELTKIAKFLECVGAGQLGVLQMKVSDIKQLSFFPIRLYPIGPREMLEKMKYFEITFDTRHDPFKWDLKSILGPALAALYQRMKIVEGHPYLSFINGSGNRVMSEVRTGDKDVLKSPAIVTDPSATSFLSPPKHPSPSRRPPLSFSSDPTQEKHVTVSTSDPSVKRSLGPEIPPGDHAPEPDTNEFDFVVHCVNGYVTAAKPEEPDYCQEGLAMLPQTSMAFEQCMPIVESMMDNKSQCLFNSSLTWIISLLISSFAFSLP